MSMINVHSDNSIFMPSSIHFVKKVGLLKLVLYVLMISTRFIFYIIIQVRLKCVINLP